MDTINLKMDIRAFYKSASIEELTEAVKEWSKAIHEANLKLREVRDVLSDALIKQAEEKIGDIKSGERVVVVRERYPFFVKDEPVREVLEGYFFFDIGMFSRESTYMRGGPYINLAKPKKDGSMGKRFISIELARLVEIKRENEPCE